MRPLNARSRNGGGINDSEDGHKLEDIDFVVVDGNNMHHDAKVILNTSQSKRQHSARAHNSFNKGSFYSNADIMGLPLPNQIKIN